MKANGIREPALTRLAGLEHVNPQFILAHIKQVRSERGNLGTAIHRIEHNWEALEVQDDVVYNARWATDKVDQWFGRNTPESEDE